MIEKHICDCPECEGFGALPCSPKIIQLLLTPNDSNWQGMLLGLADNGDTYRLDHADGWVIWFDGISKENVKSHASDTEGEAGKKKS